MATPSDPDLLLLQAAADPARLGILRQLSADGPTCACDFSDCCRGLSQSTVSHHLRVLREAGWIEGERRGTWIWYAIRPEAVERFGLLASSIRAGNVMSSASLRAASPEVRPLPLAEPDWRQW